MPEEEFLTVSELARALSISERQAARWVSRVSDADRLTTDAGQTPRQTRVRLATVIELRAKATGKQISSVKPQSSVSVMTDTGADTRLSQDRHGVSHESDVTASVRAELENEKRRAAVLEAEKEGLTARLEDTASDRDAWKEQAGRLDTRLAEALEALQRSQDAERSARLIGQRSAMQIEAVSTPEGSQSTPDVPGGTIPSPDTTNRPFWAFWKRRG